MYGIAQPFYSIINGLLIQIGDQYQMTHVNIRTKVWKQNKTLDGLWSSFDGK